MHATKCIQNQLLQGPSSLDFIMQFRTSACLSLFLVRRYLWYFQVCLPHYSLRIYSYLCLQRSALMLMISPNSQLRTEKKKKKNLFSQRHPDWHPQILMVSKLISAVRSICYMKPDCGTHLPALEHGAALHLIPHDSCDDASIGSLSSFCLRSQCHYFAF